MRVRVALRRLVGFTPILGVFVAMVMSQSAYAGVLDIDTGVNNVVHAELLDEEVGILHVSRGWITTLIFPEPVRRHVIDHAGNFSIAYSDDKKEMYVKYMPGVSVPPEASLFVRTMSGRYLLFKVMFVESKDRHRVVEVKEWVKKKDAYKTIPLKDILVAIDSPTSKKESLFLQRRLKTFAMNRKYKGVNMAATVSAIHAFQNPNYIIVDLTLATRTHTQARLLSEYTAAVYLVTENGEALTPGYVIRSGNRQFVSKKEPLAMRLVFRHPKLTENTRFSMVCLTDPFGKEKLTIVEAAV